MKTKVATPSPAAVMSSPGAFPEVEAGGHVAMKMEEEERERGAVGVSARKRAETGAPASVAVAGSEKRTVTPPASGHSRGCGCRV